MTVEGRGGIRYVHGTREEEEEEAQLNLRLKEYNIQ